MTITRRTLIQQLTALSLATVLPGCDQDNTAQTVIDRLSPSTEGFDAQGLSTADETLNSLEQLNAVIIARHGKIYLAQAYRGPDLDQPVNIKSASKTVLSLITGAALADGVLASVDQPVIEILGRRPASADPRVDQITVAHLLSMRAGLESTSGRNYGPWAVSADPVQYALTRPMIDQPGGRMIYSTGTSHILSAVLTRASGESTLALARRYLGKPLNINIPAWDRDPNGIYYGGNNMFLSPQALLRIGQMACLGGVVPDSQPTQSDSVRVLPEAWIDASWQQQGRSRWTGDGYGYGWWLRSMRTSLLNQYEVVYAWGYGGQMLYLVPKLGISAVMLSRSAPSETRRGHARNLHRVMREIILPAAERGQSA